MSTSPTIIRHIQVGNNHGYVITAFDKNSNMEVYFQVYEQSEQNNEGKNVLAYSSEYGDEQGAIAALQNWKNTGQYRPFESWIRDVNREIAKRAYGLTSMDLPDYDYRIAYDDGQEPTEVAEDVIEAAKGY